MYFINAFGFPLKRPERMNKSLKLDYTADNMNKSEKHRDKARFTLPRIVFGKIFMTPSFFCIKKMSVEFLGETGTFNRRTTKKIVYQV